MGRIGQKSHGNGKDWSNLWEQAGLDGIWSGFLWEQVGFVKSSTEAGGICQPLGVGIRSGQDWSYILWEWVGLVTSQSGLDRIG